MRIYPEDYLEDEDEPQRYCEEEILPRGWGYLDKAPPFYIFEGWERIVPDADDPHDDRIDQTITKQI